MSSRDNGSPAAGRPPAREPRTAPDRNGGAPERNDGAPDRTFWSGYDLLWGLVDQPPAARRRSSTVLDRASIVQAAIAIADAQGLEAVTMRRIAERLGTGAMSLYRHVPDKDAVVSLMIDAVLGDLFADNKFPPGIGWRAGLRMMAEVNWEVCRLHRWYPEATITQPPLTPNGTAGLEEALGLFDEFDIGIGAKMQFVTTVHFTVLHAALNLAIEEQNQARAGLSAAEVAAMASTFVQKLIGSGQYPRVTELITSSWPGGEGGQDHDRDQALAGVELILDGIESRLARLTQAG